MKSLLVVLSVLAVGSTKHVDLLPPYEDYCILENGTNRYDPVNQFDVPWFTVNLDEAPEKRWAPVISAYKTEIQGIIETLLNQLEPLFPGIAQFVDNGVGEWIEKFQSPYREEMIGIAQTAEVPLGRIVIYNIFYEIFTVCTSIIAQDSNGEIYHARNLDFGLFMGWDPKEHEWEISQHLRKLLLNINWVKDGKLVYKSSNFAGYIGILNGMKPKMFSVTVNSRFMSQGGFVGILEWLLNEVPNSKWMTWLARETFEQANSYDEATKNLMNVPLLSPVYYIVGGVNPWEGVVIARSLEKTDLSNVLDPNAANGWYLVETNYDLDQDPLYLDDRLTPTQHCMETMGTKGVGFQNLFNVLSSRTTLNKLTTLSVLFHTKTGQFETHMQACPGDCWPF